MIVSVLLLLIYFLFKLAVSEIVYSIEIENQLSRVALYKWCSNKFLKTHRKTTVLETLFQLKCKVKACNFFKMRLRDRYLSVNTCFVEIMWVAVSENNSWAWKLRLGLDMISFITFCLRLIPSVYKTFI